ncbi:MAG: hypothetical protein B0D92_02185 [Spirochaeta sp. LUC14_002_19_P3]|nr:MAG: hypothetical protein B0D92_02185 [Spirochaeta sp. LUC14_002_19_P3]
MSAALTLQADSDTPLWWKDVENSLDNAFTQFHASLTALERPEKSIRSDMLANYALNFERAASTLNRALSMARIRLNDAEAAGQPLFSPDSCLAMASDSAQRARMVMAKLQERLKKTEDAIKKCRPATQKINQVYGSSSPFYIDIRL